MTTHVFEHLTEADAVARLEADPNYRVLRRFRPRERYALDSWNLGDKSAVKLGLYVDVEATGLDRERDQITEFAAVPFSYDAQRGVVCDVYPGVAYLEEPSIPIPEDIQAITGITPEMVKGQRINDEAVTALLKDAALVIAHNAEYDRQMLERRLPAFRFAAWACSQREVKWSDFGVLGGALGNILIGACGEFTDDRHRALDDCQVGVHVLAASTYEGRTALSCLLESARQPTMRVCAVGAPRDVKDALRARGYRALYLGDRFQYWYRDVKPFDVTTEEEWCWRHAECRPELHSITAKDRYSVRAG